MTWKHIALCALGAALAVTGALAGPAASAALIPIATTLIGGAVGHAQSERKKKETTK